MTKRAGARGDVIIKGASHVSMVPHPAAAAGLIETAASVRQSALA
jgi:hypothetical protein